MVTNSEVLLRYAWILKPFKKNQKDSKRRVGIRLSLLAWAALHRLLCGRVAEQKALKTEAQNFYKLLIRKTEPIFPTVARGLALKNMFQ